MSAEKDPTQAADLPPIQPTRTEGPGTSPTFSPSESPSVTAQDFVPLDELIRTQAESQDGEPSPEPGLDASAFGAPDSTPTGPPPAEHEPAPTTPELAALPGGDLPMAPGSEPASPMDRIREFSETVVSTSIQVAATFPFSLKITGKLSAPDRARLLDFLSNENLGVREVDLEPQFDGGQILIPQVSEYAGVAIVHLLRDSGASFQLGPAGRVFSGHAEEGSVSLPVENDSHFRHESSSPTAHSAETIPVISGSEIPGCPLFKILDSLVASTTLKAKVVEFTNTKEFDEMVEALKMELRFKAFHRGGTAVLQYTLQLSPLAVPTQYRLIASGTAVRHLKS